MKIAKKEVGYFIKELFQCLAVYYSLLDIKLIGYRNETQMYLHFVQRWLKKEKNLKPSFFKQLML